MLDLIEIPIPPADLQSPHIDTPFIFNDAMDTTAIKNIMFIDSIVSETQLFYDSANSSTYPIVYSNNSNRNNLENLLTSKFASSIIDRISFVFHNNIQYGKAFINQELFFLDTDLDISATSYSPNLQLLLDIITKYQVKHIDFLACGSLNFPNWVKYYQLLTSKTNVVVGASNDETGNIKYGGDWIMESTNEDIVNIYFNSNIENYASTLASTISQAAGILYIQQSGDTIQYQSNSTSGTWTSFISSSWPVTLTNSSATPSVNILTVQLTTNITISDTTVGTGTNGYFIIGSQYITFDGNSKTVTISAVTNYPGLIQNGTSSANGQANVTVQNVGVSSSSSTLAVDGGWVCQSYFSIGVNNNIVTNCYSSGVISGLQSGGICGNRAGQTGSVTITGCYSSGAISGNNSGGICGNRAGQTGSVTITNCYSTGNITGNTCGGICGNQAGSTNGSVTITNCYSSGAIGGTNSGGICGALAGINSGSVTITDCYSTGAISVNGSGGICGLQAASTGGSVTVTACYSTGEISGSNSGGICGQSAGASGSITITNCYSYGFFTTLTNSFIPGMVGTGSVTTGITNFYVARASWSDATANESGALTGTPTSLYVNNPGTTWTSIATDTPYVLSVYNAQLYSPNAYTNPSGTYTYTSSPGLLIGKTYSILSVNNAAKPSSITINSGTGALSFNFSSDTYAIFNVKVFASQGTAPNYFGYNVNSFTLNQLCFKEGSKILYLNPETNTEEYINIENLRKGDLVKTFLHGYKPISNIGYSTMFNKVDEERTKDKLYKCEQREYPEVFEPLVITGCHSILVDCFKDETEYKSTLDLLDGKIYFTDGKTRLPACVDERANIYEIEGTHKIYHLALEHDDYYMNYGVYANGLLVETTSNRMMEEYGMTLLE